MKTIICFLFVLACYDSHAQTYAEMFRQKKTQREYHIKQIAALKVFTSYVEEGYKIAKDGLNIIQSIKRGDLGLHKTYFSSLGYVNPNVTRYSKAAAIIAMQAAITKKATANIEQCKEGKQMTSQELVYLQQSFDRLLDDCSRDLDELNALLTDGKYKMKDDERIKAIDKLYNETVDKQVFVQSFTGKANLLSLQRMKDANDVAISKRLNQVP